MIRLLARRVPLVVGAGLLALIGCGPSDKIRTYEVAKPATPAGATEPAEGGEYRILGAMYPAENPVWFFKLVGRADALAAHEAEFDKFLASVKLPADSAKPPTYDLPEGWKSAGPRSIHVDTIRIGSPEKGLELTVTPAAGGVKGNVERWAGQLGTTAEMAKHTRPVTAAGGTKGIRVDLTGPKNPVSSAPFMMGGK